MRSIFFWNDPGPCPVCDAPHTTCTSPDYAAAQHAHADHVALLSVPLRMPRVLAAAAAAQPPVVAPADELITFSTSEYRRANHGKRLRMRTTRGQL